MMQSLEIKHETRKALHFRENYKKHPNVFKIKIRQSRKAKYLHNKSSNNNNNNNSCNSSLNVLLNCMRMWMNLETCLLWLLAI